MEAFGTGLQVPQSMFVSAAPGPGPVPASYNMVHGAAWQGRTSEVLHEASLSL